MKIAICDDNKRMAEIFRQKVRNIVPEAEIFVFDDGHELIQTDEVWDVAFLDIEMKDLNGFQVAEVLNEKQPNCIFSFITTHSELAVDGYDYRPFRYILKDAPELVIERKINETVNEYHRKNRILRVSYKGAYREIFVNDIKWLEITGHCMKIILDDDIALWSRSLSEMEEELECYGLIRCHRSYIVPLKDIKELKRQGVVLKCGETISLGRAYREKVSKKYEKFRRNE